MQNRWNIRKAVFVSIGLHFLTPLLLARCDTVAGWMEPGDLAVPEKREPIVFELVEPTAGEEPDEVPETNLVSTRKSLARTEEEAPAKTGDDLPLSSGESPLKENRAPSAVVKETATPPAAAAEIAGDRPDPSSEEIVGALPELSSKTSVSGEKLPDRSLLSPSNIRREISRSVDESRLRNPRGGSALPGELSFNTVDFEYAPYLIILKRKIEEMWYPPVASYGRGFKGESVVRFAVAKGGGLDLLELVSGADHKSLDTAALNAVRYGAPFPPLPDDFPEERWEITCTFYYR